MSHARSKRGNNKSSVSKGVKRSDPKVKVIAKTKAVKKGGGPDKKTKAAKSFYCERKKQPGAFASKRKQEILLAARRSAQDILKIWQTSRDVPKKFLDQFGTIKFLIHKNDCWNFVVVHGPPLLRGQISSNHLGLTSGLRTLPDEESYRFKCLEPLPTKTMVAALSALEMGDDKICDVIGELLECPTEVSIIILEYFVIPWLTLMRQRKKDSTGRWRNLFEEEKPTWVRFGPRIVHEGPRPDVFRSVLL